MNGLSISFVLIIPKKKVKVNGYTLRKRMSLYRNYRPKDFPSLVGQDHVKTTLLNAIKSGQIAHAYLFTGPRGTGKTTTARLMAKAINAEMTEDGRFDGSEIADEIDNGRLIDVIEIDAASNRGIDEMRDLREKINYSPTRAKNKVYIIDEVHMLTKEAFNALLKTLEEPPSFVYFILATTEIHKVPETIISRCQRFDFRRITEKDLYDRLEFVCKSEGFTADDEALKIIARQARGGLRDALSLLEQLVQNKKVESENVKKVLGISNFGAVENIYKMMSAGEAGDAVAEITKIFAAGVDLVQFNKELLDYLRIEMLEKVRSGDENEARWIIQLIANFQEAYEKQKYSYIPELPLEVAIVKSSLSKSANNMDGSKKKPELNNSQVNEVKIEQKVVGAETVKFEPAALNVAEKVSATTDSVKPIDLEPVKPVEVKVETEVKTSEVKTIEPSAIDIVELKSRWTKVFDRLENALAKRCLMAGKVLEINGNHLWLGFSSNFSKDKLFIPELLAQCETAIFEEFNCRLILQGKIDASFAPVIKPTSDDFVSMRNDQHGGLSANIEKPAAAASMVNSALNIFGGEVVQ